MPRYVALLRAVNLPPHNQVKSTDLKRVFEGAGLGGVKTLLQSGNVVFESKARREAGLEAMLEKAARVELGLDTDSFVRSAKSWRALVDANPFEEEARKDPSHLLVMPLKGRPKAAAVSALVEAIPGRERVNAVGSTLYLVYPDGIGRSKLTNALIERRLGLSGTGRNWNTVQKILALLEA